MGYFVYELEADKICLHRPPWFWNMAEKIFFDEYVEDFFLSEETKLSKNVGQIKIEAGYLWHLPVRVDDIGGFVDHITLS